MKPEQWNELAALDALDALEPHERAALEDRLALDPALLGRHDAMLRTVAALDRHHETRPPAPLRAALLEAVSQRQAPLVEPSDIAVLFARQVEALVSLLSDLDEADWHKPAEPYNWTVHGLVAHLLVIEQYTAGQLHLTSQTYEEVAHLAMGESFIEASLAQAPQATAAAWAEWARATADALRSRRVELPESLSLHGWPFRLEGAVIARAFELWTHADDIRRAVGRPLAVPEPADLRTMSSFSVSTLPFTVPMVAPGIAVHPTRVVLTGPGGSTVDLGRSDNEPPRAVLVVDVVDYCRLAARRIDPDTVDYRIDGETSAGMALLAGASVFAV